MSTLLDILSAVAKSAGSEAAARVAKKAAPSIADWAWRPLQDVSKDVGLTAVPDYIQQGYGKFMQEQAGKASAGELGSRDLIKAYGITRSSVNRGAREVGDDIATGSARPEGYFSDWLMTPHGQAYLNDAQHGVVNDPAIADITQRFTPFGMADTLGKDLRYAATDLSPRGADLNSAITGDTAQWRDFAQSLNGIGPAKSGFIASMLGRGDLPTLDARQLVLQTGQPAKAASKFMRRGDGAGGDLAVDRLADRQSEMGLQIDPALAPFYQHLTHHAIWDSVGKSITTHDDVMRAMKLAGFGGGGVTLADILNKGSGNDSTGIQN